jgi:hypothetical protein
MVGVVVPTVTASVQPAVRLQVSTFPEAALWCYPEDGAAGVGCGD